MNSSRHVYNFGTIELAPRPETQLRIPIGFFSVRVDDAFLQWTLLNNQDIELLLKPFDQNLDANSIVETITSELKDRDTASFQSLIQPRGGLISFHAQGSTLEAPESEWFARFFQRYLGTPHQRLTSFKGTTLLVQTNHLGKTTRKGMKLMIGSPVSGRNFFPRPKIVSRLTKALENNNVSFIAPRRTGKTSILFHLRDQSSDDHPHFFINLETCTTPMQMIARLLEPFIKPSTQWEKKLKAFNSTAKSLIDSIDSLTIVGNSISIKEGKEDWHEPAEKLLTLLENHQGPLTYLLDEFPIFINSAAREDRDQCEALLRWFRVWRQQTASSSIRFLVTGSIGLDSVVRRHDLADTVNDFQTIELPPLDENEALELIAALAEGACLDIAPTVARNILTRLGNAYPYFIQIFIDELDNAASGDNARLITTETVDVVYREQIVTSSANEYLKHMWTRLRDALPKREYLAALAILKAIAPFEEGLSRNQIKEVAHEALPDSTPLSEDELESILNLLKHDGYLQQEAQAPFRTRYFTNLLRENCLRRYA